MDTRNRHCDVCGTVTKTLRKCTECFCKHYCSRSCQRTDWKVHRQYCKNMKQGTDSCVVEKQDDKGCSYCSSQSNLKACSGCKISQYCSRVCQKLDWPKHKQTCKKQADMSGRNSNGATQRHANTATDDQTSSKAADGTPDGTCSYCNDSGNVKTCSGCKKTQYCSRVCQKADWKSHKHRCDAHKQDTVEDSIETEGFKQHSREEKEEQESRSRSNWSAFTTQNFFGNPLRIFATLTPEQARINATRPPGSLEIARKRAVRKFPGRIILEDFEELPNEQFLFFSRRNTVLLAFMFKYHEHVMRHGVYLKDKYDAITRVEFYLDQVGDNPFPFFSYQDVRPGSYICLKDACIHYFGDGTVGIRIDDPSEVFIIHL